MCSNRDNFLFNFAFCTLHFHVLRRARHREGYHVEHVFDEDAVAGRRIVDENVSDRSDELAVLNDGRAAHALHDTARYGEQVGVGNVYGKAL